MSDDEFLDKFETCALTRKHWTHEAHVRMAWLYLTRMPFADALQKIRGGIQQLNDRFAKRAQMSCMRSKETDGYHDTITVAFVRMAAARLNGSAETFAAFRERNPDLFDRTVLLRHYSHERLHSTEARQEFIEPDRVALS